MDREEIVTAHTADGLELGGVLFQPQAPAPGDPAVLWIHGSATRCTHTPYVRIGRALAVAGYACLSADTRGRDVVSLFWRGDEPIAGGSSFERYEDVPQDIDAWVTLLAERGYGSVILAGHSLGAHKAVLYLARRGNAAAIAGCVAASPVPGWQAVPERVALAEEMVAAGRGDEPLPHMEGTPWFNIISAGTVVSRERLIGPAFSDHLGAPHVARVACPLLLLYGEEEEVGGDWIETVRRNAQGAASFDTVTITGAGHDYAGHEGAVAESIVAWWERVRDAG